MSVNYLLKYVLNFFMFFLASICFSQSKTELYIIGNIHDSVPNYHPKVLFSILDKIKPDIILHEVDSEGMRQYEQNIDVRGNEIKASNLYVKKYPKTLRFPFDFEGRNQYRKDRGMVPADNLAIKLIDSLYKEKLLTVNETKIYETFIQSTNRLMKIAELSPDKFNNVITDSIAEKRQNEQYSGLVTITDERDEFAQRFVTKPDGNRLTLRSGFKLMSKFWDLRNKTMASNIYEIAIKYPNMKIVVLTGFLHRYYLLRELRRFNNGHYLIKEFYD